MGEGGTTNEAHTFEGKFSLGIEGEYWRDDMKALVIPKHRSDLSIVVARSGADAFVILKGDKDIEVADNLLMLACIVRDMVDNG